MRFELALAFGGEAVEAPPSFAGLFDPASFDETLALEAVKEWVERSGVYAHDTAGFLLEEFAELIPVPLLDLEQRQDEHWGGAFFQFVCEHCVSDICGTPTLSSALLLGQEMMLSELRTTTENSGTGQLRTPTDNRKLPGFEL